jgi:hypothetical protein
MKILHLKIGYISEQADWWKNFIKDCHKRCSWAIYIRDPERVDFIMNEIRKAGAEPILRNPTIPGSIIGLAFEDEAKSTWFILRWS